MKKLLWILILLSATSNTITYNDMDNSTLFWTLALDIRIIFLPNEHELTVEVDISPATVDVNLEKKQIAF